jgi:hypothetical protein
VITILRLLLMSTTEKDIDILALRHQLAVLQRQIDKPQLHNAHSPSRSPNQTDWTTSPSEDIIDSAASSMRTIMLPDQHGWDFRHLQRSWVWCATRRW